MIAIIDNKTNYFQTVNFEGRKVPKNKLISPTNLNLQSVLGEKNIKIIKEIKRIADDSNTDVYLFGGIVRDCLLGRKINDIDIVINGDAIEFSKRMCEDKKGIFKGLFVKPKVKRAVVYTKGMNIDVVPLKKDGTKAIGKDELRKAAIEKAHDSDFTVNSMLIHVGEDKFKNLKLKLLDYKNSKKDLKDNLLRIIDKDSFCENPIQGFRGRRFQIQYGMKTEYNTKDCIKECMKHPHKKENWYYYRLLRENWRILKAYVKNLFS